MLRRVTGVFLFFLLTSSFVSGVGFSNPPAQREFLFVPGGHIEVPVVVSNADVIRASVSAAPGDPVTIGTPADDNILEYVRIEDPAPDSGPRQIKIVFDFPQQMRPGTYLVKVHSSELREVGGAAVSGVASATLGLTVRVLSPEKLLEITNVEVLPIAEGLSADATVAFVSRTTLDIGAVRAAFSIEGEGIEGTAGPVGLPSAAADTLTGKLGTEELKGGEYTVRTKVTYDGITLDAPPAILKIGTLHVGIGGYTRELTYDTTNKFRFNITNEWNRELRDVDALVRAGGQEKQTASLDIPPFGEREYEVYFDREPLFPLGPLPVNITITFKDYDPITGKYVEKQESLLAAPAVVEAPETDPSLQEIMLYGLVGLIVVLLIVVLLLLRRKKEEPHAP